MTIAVLVVAGDHRRDAVLIWFLRPNKDLGSTPTPVATTTPTVTSRPRRSPPTDTTTAARRHHPARFHTGESTP